MTPESAPLIMFGSAASGEVEALLRARGIAIETSTYAHEAGDGALILTPGDRPLEAGDVVALPLIEGPGVAGLPCDEHGFIPIDDHARVPDTQDVYAAGDGTTFPIKQGGIATQQADAAAEHIASRVGAPVDPQPFHPVLRGKLLTGEESLHLEHDLRAGPARGAPPSTTCGGRRTRSAVATSPRGLARLRLTPTRSPLAARSKSRSRSRGSGIGSRWRSIPTARLASTENRRDWT